MKKLLALVLAVIIITAIFPITVSAVDTVIPISECGGVIKSGATYSISTAEEFLRFEAMNNSCSGATVILTNDIVIRDGIFTIDDNQIPLYNGGFVLPQAIKPIEIFKGTFDGQGFTISGLYAEDESSAGLFINLSGATVKNLYIKNSLFIGETYGAGSIADSASNSVVQNCVSEAIVIGCVFVGGLVGTLNYGSYISDSLFKGLVIGDSYVGGLVGLGEGSLYKSGNMGKVFAFSEASGLVSRLSGRAISCFNTGDVYGDFTAAGLFSWVAIERDYYEFTSYHEIQYCYNAGNVYARNADNFISDCDGNFTVFYYCWFVGDENETADSSGNLEKGYKRYLETVQSDHLGMPSIALDFSVNPVTEDKLKSLDLFPQSLSDFVVDTGNENNGYPIPKTIQHRTVAPSITNVEYEKSFDTRNTFTITVDGRPAMIQFIEPTDGTRTYDRNHKNVTIKSYDSDGNEVNSLDRTAAYEVWSIYSNMMPNVEIRTRAKYLSDARYTWDSETYNFPMILANPIVSMELSSTSGKKGAVPATVVADEKTEKVMFKMPDNTTVTVASTATDENGNKIFTGNAWMNEDGLNEIRVLIYRDSVWRQVGTLEYTVE